MLERACFVGVPDTAQKASEHVFLANDIKPELAEFAMCPSSVNAFQYGACDEPFSLRRAPTMTLFHLILVKMSKSTPSFALL